MGAPIWVTPLASMLTGIIWPEPSMTWKAWPEPGNTMTGRPS